MSNHLYIKLETKIDGIDPNGSDRVLLAKFQEELSTIASDLQVKPLTSFYCYDADTLASYLDESELAALPAWRRVATWFHPDDALVTIKALRDFIQQDSGSLNFDADQADGELADCQKVLEAAQQQSVRFHCYVGW
jgi:hypothetical protein